MSKETVAWSKGISMVCDLPALSATLQMICSHAADALRNAVPQAQLTSLAVSQLANGMLALLQVCYLELISGCTAKEKGRRKGRKSMGRSC